MKFQISARAARTPLLAPWHPLHQFPDQWRKTLKKLVEAAELVAGFMAPRQGSCKTRIHTMLAGLGSPAPAAIHGDTNSSSPHLWRQPRPWHHQQERLWPQLVTWLVFTASPQDLACGAEVTNTACAHPG